MPTELGESWDWAWVERFAEAGLLTGQDRGRDVGDLLGLALGRVIGPTLREVEQNYTVMHVYLGPQADALGCHCWEVASYQHIDLQVLSNFLLRHAGRTARRALLPWTFWILNHHDGISWPCRWSHIVRDHAGQKVGGEQEDADYLEENPNGPTLIASHAKLVKSHPWIERAGRYPPVPHARALASLRRVDEALAGIFERLLACLQRPACLGGEEPLYGSTWGRDSAIAHAWDIVMHLIQEGSYDQSRVALLDTVGTISDFRKTCNEFERHLAPVEELARWTNKHSSPRT